MTTLRFRIKEHVSIHQTPQGSIEFNVLGFTDGVWRAIGWDMRGLEAGDAVSVKHHITIGDHYPTDVDAMEACEAALPGILASAPRSGRRVCDACITKPVAEPSTGRCDNCDAPLAVAP